MGQWIGPSRESTCTIAPPPLLRVRALRESRVLPDVDLLTVGFANQPVWALPERVPATPDLGGDPRVIEEAAHQEDVSALRDPMGLGIAEGLRADPGRVVTD